MSSRLPTFAKSMLVAGIVLVGTSSALLGQARAPAGYKEEQPNPKLVEKVMLPVVGRILRGTIPFDERTKAQLNVYYSQFALPRLTIKENLGKLPELREGLLKDLRSTKSQPVFQFVAGMIFNKMRSLADPKENFHPAVRYNAVLLLGELNAAERGSRGADGRPAAYPDPLPSALDALVAEYQNPDQIEAVRVAALVGIDRHAKLDLVRPTDRRIPVAKKKAIVDMMVALLNAAPPADRSAEGHAWMQRRAIDILAAFGMVGVYPTATEAIEKIVMDIDAPISLRCTASEALAHWAPDGKAKVDPSTVSRNLGLIAVKACKDELDRIAALELQEKEMKQLRELLKKPNPFATGQFGQTAGMTGGSGMEMMYGAGGSGGEMDSSSGDEMYGGEDMMGMYGSGGMGMGMYGMPGGAAAAIPTDPRIVWSQRRLKYQLTCVKRGLAGMAVAGKSTQHAKAVDQIAKAVEAALALTDPPEDKPDLEGLAESIRKGVNQLAFLAPAAVEPLTELPAVDPAALPGEPAIPPVDAGALPVDPATPAADPAALPGEPVVPGVDPADPPADDPGLPILPPGVE